MQIQISEFSLILLIDTSDSFAKKHFRSTEILSLNYCRTLISDKENDHSVTPEAFDLLHFIAKKRLSAGKLTVINVKAYTPLLALAHKYKADSIAIIFNLESINELKPSLEGYQQVIVFDTLEQVKNAEIKRLPLKNNLKHKRGPFDIIGDVHGCFDELRTLLDKLGYTLTHPEGRQVIFLGDLGDRGPKTPEVLRLVMDMVAAGSAFCVLGNHDIKLMRKLKGKNIKLTHGLAESMHQLEKYPPEFHKEIIDFIGNLEYQYLFDGGKLVVAHAGITENLQGQVSGKARSFALYGKPTGEIDDEGFPVRYNWAADYRGQAMVVYGHTRVEESIWLNNTICLDTGCVFGGKLTALRYPEKELVSVLLTRNPTNTAIGSSST